MAGFEVQPQNIVIGVGFRWFARFLDPSNLQFLEKSFFTPHPTVAFAEGRCKRN